MITKKNIAIIYGSTRKNRLGIRFVKYIYSQIKKRKLSPFIIDPIKDKFPLLDKRFDDFKKNELRKMAAYLNKSIDDLRSYLNRTHKLI